MGVRVLGLVSKITVIGVKVSGLVSQVIVIGVRVLDWSVRPL